MTRTRARKRASKNCVRKPARAYTHAHLPQARRYSYTPELMADVRRRYEQTEDRVVDLAADAGIHPTTFQRLAKREGWVRYVPPPRDLPAAAKLAAEAEELAAALSQTPFVPAEAGTQGQDGNAGGLDSGSPLSRGRTDNDTISRMRAAVDRELTAVETMRAQLKSVPQSAEDAERTARTLMNLTNTLERLHRLQAGAPQPTGPDHYDDTPADLDEFRLDLARRIAAFMESRPDDADAGEPDAARSGEA